MTDGVGISGELPRGNEMMTFRYKDNSVAIPVVSSLMGLKRVATSRIIPGLERARTQAHPGSDVGIAFASYTYPGDEFDEKYPEAAKALMQKFRNAGTEPSAEPKKLDPVEPRRYNLLSKTDPDDYWPLEGFDDRTFIVGPLTALPIPEGAGLVSTRQERELTTLHTDASVAIHGVALLADLALPEGGDRVYQRDLVEYFRRAFHPHSID